MNIKIKIGKYQHYKGGQYQVLGIAKHSETLEELVIYQSLNNNLLWARTKKMFLETVKHDGKTIPRFRYIEKNIK